MVGETWASSSSAASSATKEGRLVVVLRPKTAEVGGGDVKPVAEWRESEGCRLKRPKTLFGMLRWRERQGQAGKGAQAEMPHLGLDGGDWTAHTAEVQGCLREGPEGWVWGSLLGLCLWYMKVKVSTSTCEYNAVALLVQGRPHGARGSLLAWAVADRFIINGCVNNSALAESSAPVIRRLSSMPFQYSALLPVCRHLPGGCHKI